MIREPPRSTLSSSSAASDVYKRQGETNHQIMLWHSMRVVYFLGLQCLFATLSHGTPAVCNSCQSYTSARAELVSASHSLSFDSGITLTPLEQQAADALLKIRNQDAVQYDPRQQYHPQQQAIESSDLFKILKQMPKGALLHVHSLGSIDNSVAALQRPDCYVAYSPNFITAGLKLAFNTSGPPPAIENASAWGLCTNQSPSFSAFEQRVREAMLFTSPELSMSKTFMWELFDSTIGLATTSLLYAPHWENVSCAAFTELAQDGVSHVELRLQTETAFLAANGTKLAIDDLIDAYLSGVRSCATGIDSISFVMALLRFEDEAIMERALQETVRLRQKYGPDVILGFDIDDEEDRFNTIAYYAPEFVQFNLSFFFHAGETRRDLHGLDNVYSALALNASRVGHGFSLRENPSLQRVMAERGTGLEVCPLSNQILRLVTGLDDHPAYGFAAAGVPLSLSPDDPIIYGYTGVTPDYTSAMWAWNLTLPWIKQAAMNSMITAAGPASHPEAMQAWEVKWDSWVQLSLIHISEPTRPY
eukprot:TRINITY_DN28078_c0_g1_i1.p1 TRINITY_DN28078_c0_g1~~TRINITY_DN28078_c0_g1_i1.p1  ORF type:complete len:533 (-),score=106.28 TRINITY_DN28078_c0_g1_i1:31-1629(-)